MRQRTLGRTGLAVSEIGFGGGGIGGVWGPTTEEESRRAIRRALELGVNFFDVAPGYGDGLAERVLGEALAGRRDDALITTKVAMRPNGLDDIPGYVRASVEASLDRLRTDRIDLLLVHNPISSVRGRPHDISITVADALAMTVEFGRLQEAGSVRFIGFTAWRCTRAGVLELLDSGLFDVIQTEYNLLNQSAMEAPAAGQDMTPIEELEAGSAVDMEAWAYRPVDQHQAIRLAAERGLGVICIRPLLAGILSAEVDRPPEPGTQMQVMRQRASALAFLTDGGTRTLSEAAFAFCLANPSISTVIPGVKNVAEIEEAVGAADAQPLAPEEVERVADLARRDFDVPA